MLLLFSPVFPVSAAPAYMDSTRVAGLLEIQDAILNEQFDSAQFLAAGLIHDQPADPGGYLMAAAALLGEMTGAEENLFEGRFKGLLDTTLALSESALRAADSGHAAWLHLYIGHARAYRALWESRFGSFVSAARLGFSAAEAYEAGLAADSSVYDLYLGLGSFHYWKSAKAGLLRWMGLISDDKELGIHELNLAADSSVIFREAARQAMIWVQLDRGFYDSAAVASETAHNRYPDGNLFLWPLAEAQRKNRQFDESLATYRLLRDRLALNPGNYFNLISIDYQMAQCYIELGEKEMVKEIARRVRDYRRAIPRHTEYRQRNALEDLSRMARM
jgi:hypothetical protein